jgi:hypothetical protein
MKPTKFECAIALIDKKNTEDIHTYTAHSILFSKEVLYSQRMSQKLLQFDATASEALQIAARAQHVGRWEIARDAYPEGKIGYLKWRETLKKMHASITSAILEEVGYDTDFVDRVAFLIHKKELKKDIESQLLEDVICLVFLEFYFEEFAAKHAEEKVLHILKKTWKKMSETGRLAALKIHFSETSASLIKQAIA